MKRLGAFFPKRKPRAAKNTKRSEQSAPTFLLLKIRYYFTLAKYLIVLTI